MSRAASTTALPVPPLHSTSLQTILRRSRAYSPQSEPHILQDVSQTTRHYPTLHATLSPFHTRDAPPKSLLALQGTIPISYKSAHYRIPIHIWLMPNHPNIPPLAFVVPTPTMAFRARHSHVDSSNGMIYLPYLAQWSPQSTLPALVSAMIATFSAKPPVYTRPSPTDTTRLHLICDLTHRLQDTFADVGPTARQVMLARDASERLLVERRRTLSERETELTRKHAQLRELRAQSAVLKAWLRFHPPPTGHLDSDTRPRFALREQELSCRANDTAIADAMEFVDQLVVRRVMDVDHYVSCVRTLAREQFLHRVLGKRAKARLVQMKDAARRKKEGRKDVDASRELEGGHRE